MLLPLVEGEEPAESDYLVPQQVGDLSRMVLPVQVSASRSGDRLSFVRLRDLIAMADRHVMHLAVAAESAEPVGSVALDSVG